MVEAASKLTYNTADVLESYFGSMLMITGFTALTVFLEVPAASATLMLVMGLPMSLLLQLAKKAVIRTLIGG
jgi:hypothetical protein